MLGVMIHTTGPCGTSESQNSLCSKNRRIAVYLMDNIFEGMSSTRMYYTNSNYQKNTPQTLIFMKMT